MGCKIDTDHKDSQTLLITYPSIFDALDYVQPVIKIEAGARSALDPHRTRSITPYVSDVLKESYEVPNVLTIDPKRTFLDKLILLHGLQSGFGSGEKVLEDGHRQSRHYFDVAKLYGNEEIKTALKDHALLADVRKHSLISFPSAWRKVDQATPESIDLVPSDALAKSLAQDYLKMGDMILGEPPKFDEILEIVAQIQFEIRPAPVVKPT
jgi:hypothetical protein